VESLLAWVETLRAPLPRARGKTLRSPARMSAKKKTPSVDLMPDF
jgi:hypothetical protein